MIGDNVHEINDKNAQNLSRPKKLERANSFETDVFTPKT